tara:strand:- start:826 stop:1284 length:459 start_codon:yes stop_codon:yes gene_type:complete
MKNKLINFRNRLLVVFSLITFGLLSIFIANIHEVNATMSNLNQQISQSVVIEHLRLRVPAKYKDAWLQAEKKSWQPWLEQKDGFIERRLFWDEKYEEAIILISWSDREKWKSIPQENIQEAQEIFEEYARNETGNSEGNPFPLTFEGELKPL